MCLVCSLCSLTVLTVLTILTVLTVLIVLQVHKNAQQTSNALNCLTSLRSQSLTATKRACSVRAPQKQSSAMTMLQRHSVGMEVSYNHRDGLSGAV